MNRDRGGVDEGVNARWEKGTGGEKKEEMWSVYKINEKFYSKIYLED